MQAGDLDRQIQFRRYTETDDGYGVKKAWVDHGAKCWARRTDVSDGERMAAGWVEATLASRFVVRWSAFTLALTPKDRLVTEGVTYEILGIKESDGRHQWLELTALTRADV